MEFTSIDGVSVRPDGVALLTSPFSPPGAKSGSTSDGDVGGEVRHAASSRKDACCGRSAPCSSDAPRFRRSVPPPKERLLREMEVHPDEQPNGVGIQRRRLM